jgi:transcription initiation factor TFIIE subunit alpha
LKKEILNLNITKDFLTSVGGKQAPDIVKICLSKNKEVTDEEIGKKTPLKITEIRTILNQLHYRGIACYNKTKGKRSGWYNYTWSIKTKRIAELLLEQKIEELTKLERKQEEIKNYETFACNNKCAALVFEIAAEYKFKCPECGKQMNLINSKKTAKETNKRAEIIKKEINLLKKAV